MSSREVKHREVGMTIVKRATFDMFDFAGTADLMVNPVNLTGAMGKGIAKEFRDRFPDMFEKYKVACAEKRLQIGKIQLIKVPPEKYAVVNLPTKDHWVHESKVEYVRKGLAALQRLLERPEYRYAHVVMPMLGCGYGKLGYDQVEPSFYEYLDGLDAVVSLSMNPEFLGYVPTYLGIVGPRCWANIKLIGKNDASGNLYTEERYQQEYKYVEDAVLAATQLWGVSPSSFSAFISGGATGVDTVACGSSRTDPTYELSLAKKYSKPLPVICYADWNRHGNAAGMIRNRLVADIATHVVVIRPPGVTSIGTTAMARLLQNYNRQLPEESAKRKHVYIQGDIDLSPNVKRIRMV